MRRAGSTYDANDDEKHCTQHNSSQSSPQRLGCASASKRLRLRGRDEKEWKDSQHDPCLCA